MGLLQDSTDPKAVAFLEGMAKIQELADNFIANPTDDNYRQFRSYTEPAELYIMSVMGFDPYVKMEAVSMLEEIQTTVWEVYNATITKLLRRQAKDDPQDYPLD